MDMLCISILEGTEQDAIHLKALLVINLSVYFKFKMRILISHIMAYLVDMYRVYSRNDQLGACTKL